MGIDISQNQVQLWLMRDKTVCDPYLLAKYRNYLTPQEKRKGEKFYFAKDRKQYLLTRSLVRSVLYLYEPGVAPEDWRFRTNRYGKPFINNKNLLKDLYFNLSHTDGMIVVAVSGRDGVGVDIEYSLRKADINIARRYFSADEFSSLISLPPERQLCRFFELWTLKEAYIKGIGKGLHMPLDSFSVLFNEDRTFRFRDEDGDGGESWCFWTWQPEENYVLSLACYMAAVHEKMDLIVHEVVPDVYEKELFRSHLTAALIGK